MAEEQGRKRRAYDETFKRDAVALMLKGDRSVMQLA
jgi:transposase-like protein